MSGEVHLSVKPFRSNGGECWSCLPFCSEGEIGDFPEEEMRLLTTSVPKLRSVMTHTSFFSFLDFTFARRCATPGLDAAAVEKE